MVFVPVFPLAGQNSRIFSDDMFGIIFRGISKLFLLIPKYLGGTPDEVVRNSVLETLAYSLVYVPPWSVFCNSFVLLTECVYCLFVCCRRFFLWIGLHLQNAPPVRVIGECRIKLMVENNSDSAGYHFRPIQCCGVFKASPNISGY